MTRRHLTLLPGGGEQDRVSGVRVVFLPPRPVPVPVPFPEPPRAA